MGGLVSMDKVQNENFKRVNAKIIAENLAKAMNNELVGKHSGFDKTAEQTTSMSGETRTGEKHRAPKTGSVRLANIRRGQTSPP